MASDDIRSIADRPTTRRDLVLDAALSTFSRHGFRKSSMEQLAQDADISRPGLYLHFSSKEDLFRATMERAVALDLAAAEAALEQEGPLGPRLLDAFDHWAGRYVGALTRDVPGLLAANPDLLSDVASSAPRAFARLIDDALGRGMTTGAAVRSQILQTLLNVSAGAKQRVDDRSEYRRQMHVAITLLVEEAATT